LSQVIVPRIYANLQGTSLEDVSLHIGDVSAATWFALAAVLSLVIGMWYGQGTTSPNSIRKIQAEARSWSPLAAFVFSLTTIAIASCFGALGKMSAGLIQPALAASSIQWLGVFVLTCVCTAQRRGFGYLLLVAGAELVQGFVGFFADFRQVFI